MMKHCGLKLQNQIDKSGIEGKEKIFDSKDLAACVISLYDKGFTFTQSMVLKEKY